MSIGGGLAECWQVNQVIYKHDPGDYSTNKVSQNPQTAIAVRNQHYKLVHNQWFDYDIQTDGPIMVTSAEFYRVNEQVLIPLLDKARLDLLPGGLKHEQQVNFDILQKQMNAVLASAPPCPGDSNGDGVVDDKDVTDFYQISNNWGKSSHYDFNLDGLTNIDDLMTIYDNFGPCPRPRH